eukprot:3956494-Pyramimonas_sp.AAC.2
MIAPVTRSRTPFMFSAPLLPSSNLLIKSNLILYGRHIVRVEPDLYHNLSHSVCLGTFCRLVNMVQQSAGHPFARLINQQPSPVTLGSRRYSVGVFLLFFRVSLVRFGFGATGYGAMFEQPLDMCRAVGRAAHLGLTHVFEQPLDMCRAVGRA